MPGDEGDLRRAKEVAEEMRECLVATSRAVRPAPAGRWARQTGCVRMRAVVLRVHCGSSTVLAPTAPPLATPLPPQAERVVDKLDRLGAVCGDLGLALFKVAKAEEAQVCVCLCVYVYVCVCVEGGCMLVCVG